MVAAVDSESHSPYQTIISKNDNPSEILVDVKGALDNISCHSGLNENELRLISL